MPHTELIADIIQAFAQDAQTFPAVTLRGGDALEAGKDAPPHDVIADAESDAYLEAHPWGTGWLDAPSWRHYLPYLFDYALRHLGAESEVVDALLTSLRPPDREPPRLASLDKGQETVVLRALDVLAFAPGSAHADLASRVLDEWWTPGAIPRRED